MADLLAIFAAFTEPASLAAIAAGIVAALAFTHEPRT
jgi:hypothetical protein